MANSMGKGSSMLQAKVHLTFYTFVFHFQFQENCFSDIQNVIWTHENDVFTPSGS